MADATHRYSQEEKDAAVELYFSCKKPSLRDVIKELGYPSISSLNIWITSDPRYEGKRNHSHSRRSIVAYCRENPQASFDEVHALFGRPESADILKKWLAPSRAPGRTKGEKRAIVAYCRNNPNTPLSEVIARFGYPDEKTLRQWLENPNYADRRRRQPSER